MVARPFVHTIAERAADGTSRINLCDGMDVGFRLIQKAAFVTNSEQKTKRITNKNAEIMMKNKPITDKRTEYGNILRKHRSLN